MLGIIFLKVFFFADVYLFFFFLDRELRTTNVLCKPHSMDQNPSSNIISRGYFLQVAILYG